MGRMRGKATSWVELVAVLLLLGPTVGAASPPGPPGASVAGDAAESLLREYDALPKTTPAAQYDRFVATHPGLLTASARPYGPALLWALEFERSEAAMALLRAGAAIPPGAVTLAARGGMDEIIPLLVARGAQESDRDTAMLAAAKYGHASTLRLLIALGAKVAVAAPNDGFTPLHVAVMDRRIEAIRVLLAAGAPLEARDHHGQTPLGWGPFAYVPQAKHIYQKLGQPHDTVFVDPGEAEAMKLLLDAGASLTATDDEGNTALHHAALLGSVRGAEVLLARGASVTVKNRKGQTPLSLAKTRQSPALFELLQKHPSRSQRPKPVK
jgi:hypothetical protein